MTRHCRLFAGALTLAVTALTGVPASASAGTADQAWAAGCGLIAGDGAATLGMLPVGSPAGARGRMREPARMAEGAEVPAGAGQAPQNFAGTIPVYFHVISSGPSPAEGNVRQSQIDRQIAVLNRAFAGGYGGVATPFSFFLAGVTRTQNSEWFSMGYNSQAERRAKTALRAGGADALNIYSTDGAGDSLLGWATFPSHYAAQSSIDGIVVHYGSLPGGFIDNFDLGHTATHEAGHWFGLYHTFQNGCSTTGDQVEDTPRQRFPTSGCPEGKDTCPQPGLDPIHNYMDYSHDRCYSEFTAGQSARMTEQFVFFRGG
jgi:Pregnancy-associated plasma protein-A